MKKLLVVLCCAVLSLSSAAAPRMKKKRVGKVILNQKVVRLKNSAAKERVKLLIPPAYEFLIEGDSFLVIRARKETPVSEWEPVLKDLKSSADVLSIESDFEAMPLEHDKGKGEPAVAVNGKPSDLAEGDAAKCHLSPHCRNRNPAWARLQVGADLGDKIVAAVAAKSKTPAYAKVAVVDTGFDSKTHSASIDAKAFRAEKGHAKAGAGDTDVDGHGTGVTGMISGKGIGVTSQVELTTYRHTENNAAGRGSAAFIAAAVEKACEENDVVNLSWGTLADELGGPEEDELWYEAARKKGCLVIHAAGNSGIKKNDNEFSLLSPVLKVGATDEFSEDSPFSTVASVYGPGAGVFTLLSSAADGDGEGDTSACSAGKGRVGPTNGTSFAAPLVSAVAGQVITLLKSNGVYPANPRKRLAMVKSILKASADWSRESGSRRPVVNSLLAALIANEVGAESPMNSSDLIKLGRNSESNRRACDQPIENCTAKVDCGAKKACVNELRYHFIACSPAPAGAAGKPQKELHEWLFESLKQLEERELTLQVIERMPTKGKFTNEIVQELDRQWKELLPTVADQLDGQKGIVELSEGRALNLLYAARRAGVDGEFKIADKIRDLLRGAGVSDFITFRHPLGTAVSQSGSEARARQLMELYQGLPVEQQLDFISEIPWLPEPKKEALIQDFNFEGENPFNFLYFLDAKKSELRKPVRVALEKRMKELAAQWFSGELTKRYAIGLDLDGVVQEALFKYYPDGNKKLAKLLEQPLDANHLAFYRFALTGPVLTHEQKQVQVRKWTADPAFRTAEHSFLQAAAMAWAFKSASPEFISDTVVPEFLSNPVAKVPREAIASGSMFTENQAQAAVQGIFPDLTKVNLERGTKKLTDPTLAWAGATLEIENLMTVMRGNTLFNADDQIDYFKDGVKALLEKYVHAAATEALKANGFKFTDLFRAKENTKAAINTMSTLLENQELFAENKMTDVLKKGFEPVKADLEKNPAKYTAALKQQIKRLYGLAE